MITRRGLLALIPTSAAFRLQADEPRFDRIDTHIHLNRHTPAMLAGMRKSGWRALTISVSIASSPDEKSNLDEETRGNAEASRQSGGRIAWAASFDARAFENRDFTAHTIADLRQHFKNGAIAVKIWKNIGMAIRSKSGEYLMPDNPVLLPIYESIQKEDRTLVAHLAEPNGAWMPLDDKNPEIGYYGSHPEWHMYGRPVPSKESILQARDRFIARFPKLRIVGCHLGSNEDDLDALAKRLDRFPNFAVDMAARVRYFVAGDREKVRAFLLKYQDRLTYATDFTLAPKADPEAAWKNLDGQHSRDWNFFAGNTALTYGRREAQGLGLPEKVLRKLFFANAARWYPGIAPQGA